MTTFIEMLTIQWTPRETWIGDLTISIHLVIQHTEKAKKSSQSGSFVTQNLEAQQALFCRVTMRGFRPTL